MKNAVFKSKNGWMVKLSAFLSRYHFLVRMITLGVILLFVIILASSVLVFSRSYKRLQETTDSAMETMAQSVDSTMSEYLRVFDSVGRACLATPYTYEPFVESKFNDNTVTSYAAETLRGYSLSIPIVTGIGIYYNSSQRVLYNNYNTPDNRRLISWDPCALYCTLMVPKIDRDVFIKRLYDLNAPQFVEDSTLLSENRMLYLVPVSINKGVESRRVLIFDITSDSFVKYIGCTLGSAYTVDSLYWRDQCIFNRTATEERHTFHFHNPGAFSVSISISNEVYRSIFSDYSASIWRLICISMLLCTALLAMYIAFSYRPLNQIVRQTGAVGGPDELSAVKGYLSRKEQMETELKAELENEKELSRLKALEMLLLGVPFHSSGDNPLPDRLPYHVVAVAPLRLIQSVNDRIIQLRERLNVTAFEQYRAGYFVMIYSSENENAREEFTKSLTSIDWNGVPFGVGSVCIAKEQLHRSYLDAIISFRKNTDIIEESRNVFGDAFTQKEYDSFRSKLMANDVTCIQTAQIMFERLNSLEPSFLFYWHSNMRLIEQFYDCLQELGYPIQKDDCLQYSTEQDVKQMRALFLASLEKFLSDGPRSETAAEKELGEKIVLYINDNLSNDMFGITDIADTFNMSKYTVSKLIRDKTGMYFKRYLTAARLDMAKVLLASDKDSIRDISQRCGFASASYFIRVFNNEIGVTPLQYRHSTRGM